MIISLSIIFVLIFLDQITKYISKLHLENKPQIDLIPHLLRVEYVENKGAAYGILKGYSIVLFVVTILALIAFGYLLTKQDWKTKKTYTLAIIFLIGGSLGNAFDRLLLGYVIDFINFPFLSILGKIGNFTCNLADIFITIGIILFLIDTVFLFPKRDKLKQKKMRDSIYENNKIK